MGMQILRMIMDKPKERLHIMQGWFHCGGCSADNVRIIRLHASDPWTGICTACGMIYPVIRNIDDKQGKYILAADFDMASEATSGSLYNLGVGVIKTGEGLASALGAYRKLVKRMRAEDGTADLEGTDGDDLAVE
jgi:hypothetical protein